METRLKICIRRRFPLALAVGVAALLTGVPLAALRSQTSSPASAVSDAPPAPPSARPVQKAVPVLASPGPAASSAIRPAAPVIADASAPAAAENGSTHVVNSDDLVTVKVYQEDDLLTTARVAKDGTINFPLIGTVSIGGKTPNDAARVIAGELAKDFLVNPQVQLTVIEYSKRRFTVLGEVQKPGQYDMPDRDSVTLLEAIGAAGGYTRIADPSNIRLKRLDGGKETVFKLNAKSMANERATVSFEVKPGDIITVGESFF